MYVQTFYLSRDYFELMVKFMYYLFTNRVSVGTYNLDGKNSITLFIVWILRICYTSPLDDKVFRWVVLNGNLFPMAVVISNHLLTNGSMSMYISSNESK